MIRRWFTVLLAGSFAFSVGFQTGAEYKKIHLNAVVIDMHNDVIQRVLAGEDLSVRTHHGHSDLPRFREGGLDVVFFSVWVPPEKTARPYYDQANEQIDSIESFVRRNPSQVGFARTSWDIRKFVKEGKFAAMIGMEGGHPVGNDLDKIDHFYKRGVRYMTLTWNNSTDWATSAKDETSPNVKLDHRGLSEFGKQVVRKMSEVGMVVDISHVGEQTFWDVMRITTKPVIASHSSVWTLCHHRRNLKDDQLKAIAKTDGVVCVNFAPFFIDSTFAKKEEKMLKRNQARIDSFRATIEGDEFIKDQRVGEFLRKEYKKIQPPLSKLVDHIDYIAKLIGIDHVGIGSDFDGINSTPKEMDDVTFLPNITRELLKRGYSERDIGKILGFNVIRVLQMVEPNK